MNNKPILIVKNITREGQGLLDEVLSARNVAYTVVDLHAGESFPEIEEFGAIVVLGGPDSANDTTEKMQTELRQIKNATDAGIPYLGICLGLQTLVKANGGAVVQNAVREIGFRDAESKFYTVEITEKGTADPLFAGLDTTLPVFHLHGETVEVTDSMDILATGKHCTNQIVKIGENAYGIQCHFELTPEMFEVWITEDPELLELDTEQLRRDFASERNVREEIGKKLFSNFLDIAGY